MTTDTVNILIVDDHREIVNVLNQLITGEFNVQCKTAVSGLEALELIKSETFDILMSDRVMPGMDGLTLMDRARETQPEILLILLSGQTVMEDLTSAINEHGISFFINKPWQTAELSTIVRQAIARIQLTRQNAALLVSQERKNVEISRLAATLETSFLELIRLLSDILAETSQDLATHAQQVATLSEQLAEQLGWQSSRKNNLEIASRLHDLGLLGLPTTLYTTPYSRLAGDHRRLYEQHPKVGAEMLRAAPRLKYVRRIIMAHHENLDGSGFLSMTDKEIPYEAKIIRVCDFYDESVSLLKQSHQDTIGYMQRREGSWFDSECLQAFLTLMAKLKGPLTIPVSLNQLLPGMIAGRDIRSRSGSLIITNGTMLTGLHLKRLKIYNQSDSIDEIYILRE